MIYDFSDPAERIAWIFELYHVNDVWRQYLSCTHPDERVPDIFKFIDMWPEVSNMVSENYKYDDNLVPYVMDVAQPYFQEHYTGRFFTGPQRISQLVQRFPYVDEYVIDCRRYKAERLAEKVMFWENDFDMKMTEKYWFESPKRLCVVTKDEKK